MRAWVGWRLTFRLVAKLGPRRSLQVAKAVGIRERSEPQGATVSRSTFLKAAFATVAGALLVVSTAQPALASSRDGSDSRPTAGGNGSSGLDRLPPEGAKEACDSARSDSSVVELSRRLREEGLEEYPEADAAVTGDGATIAVISFCSGEDRCFARIRHATGKISPTDAHIALLTDSGPVPKATLRAGAAPTIAPGSLWDCVAMICPTCVPGCIITGPFYFQCLLDCCIVAIAICTL